MKRYRLWLVVVTLSFSIIACQYASQLTDQLSSSGDAIFRDDYSQPYAGWSRGTDLPNGGISDYSDGKFRILVNEPNFDYWSNPNLSFKNSRVEVDAARQAGPDINRFGLICRYKDELNYYFFIISSDGYYGVGKVKDNHLSMIGMKEMLPSDAVLLGSELNHLRADCIGDQLFFYVNGRLLTQVSDSDFSSGDVGILAGTFDQPGVDIAFDNFVVVKP
jgi:hypothetical protein